MKVENMSIVELKALGYDKAAMIQQLQRELAQINNLIIAKINEAETPKDKIKKPKDKNGKTKRED